MNEQYRDKINQVLTDLAGLVRAGLVTKEEVLSVLGENQPPLATSPKHPSFSMPKINLQKILYYVGGLIVILGIVFFIAQFWSTMSQISKTVTTLVPAISAYSLGYYFFRYTQNKEFGHAFLVISAVLFPLGVGTALDVMGISATTAEGISINAALLFMISFTSYAVLKAPIFLPLSVLTASVLFLSLTDFIFYRYFVDITIPKFTQYRILSLGIAYLAFGYYFAQTNRQFMSGGMYFLGLLMVLGIALVLQGFKDFKDKDYIASIFWQVIYPFLLAATFWGSIKLQSRVFLLMATFFTFAEILKLTAQYFSESISWPLSLVIGGLIIMGIGYMSFEINKRFLQNSARDREPSDNLPQPPTTLS